MTLGLTMMVRDEADIIETTLDYYVQQGVDHIVVTDNASIDGTTEILERFASQGKIELWHDPEHRKNQAQAVTKMARHLALAHRVDWVINSDADEFLRPARTDQTLAIVFDEMPSDIKSFTVPVVNMAGPLNDAGFSFDTAVWRDGRRPDQLRAVGLLAQPTHNAIHIGDSEVEVSQGNHFVSIASEGQPPTDLALEVLHFPWRSWAQYAARVEATGRAYTSNPHLKPSPNHHGMRDYQRLQVGILAYYFAARLPSPHTDPPHLDGFIRDDSLGQHLSRASLATPPEAQPAADARFLELATVGRELIRMGNELADTHQALNDANQALEECREALDTATGAAATPQTPHWLHGLFARDRTSPNR